MSFELLHPTLQYHIANTIGWPGLRPVQEACIEPILADKNIIVLAQTAGGKTEASFFPIISRILAENWEPLSVLYICPLKALLNNQEHRLKGYFEMVGHRAEVWHGDVTPGQKKKILDDPPSCLLATPESLEAILVSRGSDHNRFFKNIKAVVIDEVHAFANDDRGWHLLAILARLTNITKKPIQRIGLSATVGNPEEMVKWLSANPERKWEVVQAPSIKKVQAEVTLDFVGSLSNAAKVIDRLHRGEKRLVFTDSRSRSEELGGMLNQLGTRTFVTHSSLSKDLRTQTERAFAEESNCVIVATSALELGIDIGDLDRVIQIDSPGSVSSFLQRMGRTGRRSGTQPNCLFLATSDKKCLQAAGLIHLWKQGFVEPAVPPPRPYHVLAQQILALTLQHKGLRTTHLESLQTNMHDFGGITVDEFQTVLNYIEKKMILTENDGYYWFDSFGEKLFGRKNFLETLSVFTSPPLLMVMFGTKDVATIDKVTFNIDNSQAISKGQKTTLTLGGKHWDVTNVDWKKMIVYVKPSKEKGKTRWMGADIDLSEEMAQSQKDILINEDSYSYWSSRCNEGISELRSEYDWLCSDRYRLRSNTSGQFELWTFFGTKINRVIAQRLEDKITKVKFDAFYLHWSTDKVYEENDEIVKDTIDNLKFDSTFYATGIDEELLKFHECCPPNLLDEIWKKRLTPTISKI